jgi:fibronectin-binding autotransporter adhesin
MACCAASFVGNLAKNSTNAADGAIVALVGADYTDVPRVGGSIADAPAANVRIVNGGTSGSLTPASTVTTINTLTQSATDGVAGVVLAGGKTLRVGSIVAPAGSGGLNFATGTLTVGGAANTAGELFFLQNSAIMTTVNSVVADNGTGVVSLTKAGTGTLALGLANSYKGVTTVSGGVLVITAENGLGGNPLAFSSQLTLNGGTLRGAANVTLDDSNRGVTLDAGGGTFSPDAGSRLTVANVIAGTTSTGGLTKSGDGLVVLSAVNTPARRRSTWASCG